MNSPLERIAPATARLLETDMHMGRLADDGILATLDREGVLDHRIVPPADLDTAIREPPARGRARIRSACIKRLAGSPNEVQCFWDRIVDRTQGRWLDLRDPFQSEGGTWAPLPQHKRPSDSLPDPSLAPIARAVAAGVPPVALHYMRTLLATTPAPTLAVCEYCTRVIDDLIPDVPMPMMPRGIGDPAGLLKLLFDRAAALDNYALEDNAGMLLYHCHQARGRFELAGQVAERMLARSEALDELGHTQRNLNNLGYTYMLRQEWGVAEPLLERSIAICLENDWAVGAANSRANLLHCRFSHLPPERWHRLIPMLTEANRILVEGGDWRARKTLRLLSRLALHRGRPGAARAWARRAVDATEGVATQLRERDLTYLRGLLDDEPGREAHWSSDAQLSLI